MSRCLLVRTLVAPAVLFALVAAGCGSHTADAASASPDSAPSSAAAGGPKVSAAKFCPALMPKVQSLVKVSLSIIQANDETNDELHTGDAGYVSCTYGRQDQGYRITTGMHAGDVSHYEGTTEKGFTALPGFGDNARAYDASIRWVDVVKGSTACETILTVADESLTEPDWKQVAGKMCNA
ncbi:MAG: hypothetical protein ACREND_10070, partial [Gemmatimonadaceae bacterium]